MWIAWFRRRLPPVFRRWRFVGPEQAGIGAVPFRRAKRLLLWIRSISPTSPMIRAAIRSPTPASCDRPLVRLLLEAGLRKGEARRLRLRHVDVEQSRLVIVEGKGGKDRVVPVAS